MKIYIVLNKFVLRCFFPSRFTSSNFIIEYMIQEKKRDLIIMKSTNDLKAKEEKIIKGLVLNLQIPHIVRFEPK